MPDIRELFDQPEEAFRTMWAGIQSHMHTMLISKVTANSDGKTLQAVPAVKQRLVDKTGTQTTYSDMALLVDVPLHFPGGARMSLTHGVAEADETAILFNGRAHDEWFQNGAGAMPVSERMHSLSDGIAFPGLHSTPRELKQIDTAALHIRDDSKLHVHETHPDRGHRTFSADPSTPPASDSFDPLTQATKFVDHVSQALQGSIGRAVDGEVEHSHGSFHGIGSWLKAMAPSGLVQALAHPALGGLISAADGKNSVTATMGGVMLQSPTAISFDVPPGGLELPAGGVSASALAAGAASANVGPVGGDLSGSLPNPTVVSIAHLVGMDKLPRAASDSAAAQLNPPVAIGSPYLNTAVSSGVALLAIRIA